MQISKRIQETIEIILGSSGYVPIPEIAKRVGASDRTIYRELPEVTQILGEGNILLESASKKGVRAVGDEADKKAVLAVLGQKKDVYVVNAKDREDLILLYLLQEDDYLKVEAVAIDNDASVPTVRADLARIQETLSVYDLQLVQKKGAGVLIRGEEIEKNHLLAHIILAHVDEYAIYHWLSVGEARGDPFLRRLEKYGYLDVLQKGHAIFREPLADRASAQAGFGDRDYLEFLFLASLMVYCRRRGRPYTGDFVVEGQSRRELRLAGRVADRICEAFDTVLSDTERQYLAWVVHIGMIPEDEHMYTIRNHRMDVKTQDLIRYVEERMGIRLLWDPDIRGSFQLHLDKALSRIRSGMSVRNDVLEDLKKEYGELFSVIRGGLEKEFPDDYFPDDEVGYMVMYFAVTLDKVMKRSFRIIVVCSGGMGSSKMLAGRLEQEIPEIRVQKTASLLQFSREDPDDYDLILSTIPLYRDGLRYLKVSPLLSPNELEQIRDVIRRHKYQALRRIEVREAQDHLIHSGDSVAALHSLRNLADIMVSMVDGFYVENKVQTKSVKTDLVYKLMEEDAFCGMDERQTRAKFQEEIYFVIPNTEVLYDECLVHGLPRPMLLAFNYEYPDVTKRDPNEYYKSAICILYDPDLPQGEKALIRHAIERVLDDSVLHEMLRAGDERGLRQWFAWHFRQYLMQL